MKMILKNRRVQVYETDLMGIVHHSNYIRFMEEARVAWFIEKKLLDESISSISQLTVIDVRTQYLRPLKYGNRFSVDIQIKTEGVKVWIQYKIFNEERVLCCIGESVHCAVDDKLKVKRLNQDLVQKIKETSWIETWL